MKNVESVFTSLMEYKMMQGHPGRSISVLITYKYELKMYVLLEWLLQQNNRYWTICCYSLNIVNGPSELSKKIW